MAMMPTTATASATTRNLIYICKDLLLDNTHVCFQLLFPLYNILDDSYMIVELKISIIIMFGIVSYNPETE